jgi:fumarate hydratase, class II
MATRTETDSFGAVEVPEGCYYGAQTARSLHNFPIGSERMPIEIVRALAVIKKAAALANREVGWLDAQRTQLICAASDEVIAGVFDAHFPLVVWQTGSGTHTNMNVNEVIANRANELAGHPLGSKQPVHPNDHVNLAQSSNDTFPTATHIAAVQLVEDRLLPAARGLRDALELKAQAFMHVIKIGRTHLQDATPLTLGQEISAWVAQLDASLRAVETALPALRELAIGGTAVGTGLNAHPRYAELVIARIRESTGRSFTLAENRFAALAGLDALVGLCGALVQLATACTKIANDVRWLASGPRAGLGEIRIPENEPGSSIMPGKVNPSQCEMLTMVCCRVFANATALGFAASQGNFQLNVYRPVAADAALQSIRLLADGCASFTERCARGIEANQSAIDRHLHGSLMLVTALSPKLGYDAAARVAKHAHETGKTLRDSAIELGLLTGEAFDAAVRPERMLGPSEEPR